MVGTLNKWVMRLELSALEQKQGESVDNFVCRLKAKAGQCKFSDNAISFTPGQGTKYSTEMSAIIGQSCDNCEEIVETNWHFDFNDLGNTSRAVTLQTVADAQQSWTEARESVIRHNNHVDTGVQGRSDLVDKEHQPIQWQDNHLADPRLGDGHGCITQGLGGSVRERNSTGLMEHRRTEVAHKPARAESSTDGDKISGKGPEVLPHSVQNRAH